MVRTGARSGYTLFEVLVVLPVLSLVAGIVVAGRPGGGRMDLERRIGDIRALAASQRNQAVTKGLDTDLRVEGAGCDEVEARLMFFADGTARGTDVCLGEGDQRVRLVLDPLTGRLERAGQ